ncbi:MAG: hypothetical protein EPN86_06580 [Nanoarchaeota archaeon]|nr:MAG: hypothetical protein EPN86_06580 [Nanoarchaeota archaeon]
MENWRRSEIKDLLEGRIEGVVIEESELSLFGLCYKCLNRIQPGNALTYNIPVENGTRTIYMHKETCIQISNN